MMKFIFHLFIFATLCVSCNNQNTSNTLANFKIAEPNASPETKALFANLLKYQDSAIMYGHQDDLSYGVSWWAELLCFFRSL